MATSIMCTRESPQRHMNESTYRPSPLSPSSASHSSLFCYSPATLLPVVAPLASHPPLPLPSDSSSPFLLQLLHSRHLELPLRPSTNPIQISTLTSPPLPSALNVTPLSS